MVDILMLLVLCARADPAVRALPEPWSASACRERHACLPSVTGETVSRGFCCGRLGTRPRLYWAAALLLATTSDRTDAYQTRALRTDSICPPPRTWELCQPALCAHYLWHQTSLIHKGTLPNQPGDEVRAVGGPVKVVRVRLFLGLGTG